VIALFAARVVAQESEGAAAPGHGKAAAHAETTLPHGATHGTAASTAHGGDEHGGPVPPPDINPTWVGVVLILVAAMFVMAAVIGPIARMHAPPAEMPVTHSHDEPPGASHHHGHSGTINPEPNHGHASDQGHGHH